MQIYCKVCSDRERQKKNSVQTEWEDKKKRTDISIFEEEETEFHVLTKD